MQLWTFGQEEAVGKNWKYRHFLFQGFPKLLPFFSHGLFQLARVLMQNLVQTDILDTFSRGGSGIELFPMISSLSSFGLLANWKGENHL